MLKKLNLQNLIQQVPAIVPNFCDRCGAKHSQSDFEIVSQDIEKVMCKLSCYSCGNTYIIHVNTPIDGSGIFSARRASFPSEITTEEIRKFSNVESINNDEILDVFIALRDVKNIDDFNVLFSSEVNNTSFAN
jgi:hypothetical protein